jgi:hypothetical protein
MRHWALSAMEARKTSTSCLENHLEAGAKRPSCGCGAGESTVVVLPSISASDGDDERRSGSEFWQTLSPSELDAWRPRPCFGLGRAVAHRCGLSLPAARTPRRIRASQR